MKHEPLKIGSTFVGEPFPPASPEELASWEAEQRENIAHLVRSGDEMEARRKATRIALRWSRACLTLFTVCALAAVFLAACPGPWPLGIEPGSMEDIGADH